MYIFKGVVIMEQNKSKNKRWLIIAIALLLVFLISLGGILWYFLGGDGIDQDSFKNPTPSNDKNPSASSEIIYVDNPIDFASLQAQNPDVCGWITVPNTNIDYPILQSSPDKDNDFYINHNLEGKYSAAGSIYIQRNNSNQFTDRNTVIYGHNMKNKTMFRTLHNFRDPKFFEENEFFTIYTPGHIKTYRIFAAYRYDNRHILNSFDFTDKAVYEEYLKFATNPVSLIKNVREGVKVTADDPIVTLSTCISDKRYRYLVQGVLIKDELTK